MNDEALMRRALELAERGRYSVSPNPMVGCVIARDGSVLAEGWHRRGDDARRLNETFLHAVTHKRPFVIVKAAMTLDGKLATVDRDSQWITADAARERSLALREAVDAIVVGGGTVRDDNPRLTRRLGWNGSIQPWLRVVLDRDRVVPPDARVLTDGGKTLHITEDVPLDEMLRNLN